MLEKEERVMMQDADEIKRNAESIPEMKLAAAVRSGVTMGRRREMRRVYKYGAVAAAAAAAAIILFSTVGLPLRDIEEKTIQTSSENSVTDFESYRPIGQRDSGFAAAMEQGLLKPIKQGVEKNGYRVDVAGAVSDGRKAFIMFSVQNHTKHVSSPVVDSLYLGDVEAPSAKAAAINVRNSSGIMPGETAYYVYATNLVPSVKYGKDAKISFKVWDTKSQVYQKGLDISFPLDADAFKETERIYHPEEALMVAGQKINVRQVQFTALNTYVDLEYDQANDKQIFKVISPVMIGTDGEHIEKLYYPQSVLDDNTRVTLVYKKSRLDQMDQTSLKIFGIAAVNKEQLKVVVDLKERKIVSAPDAKLQILPEKEDQNELYFYRLYEKAQAGEGFGMWLAPTYTDANGEKHDRKSPQNVSHGGTTYSSRDHTMEDETTYNFGDGASQLPQPLTIEVKQYWMPIMETQSVELASKS